MRIATTYENGKIFQHFGRTEAFKIYNLEDGLIRSTEMIETNGTGHGALAGILAENMVDLLICGGIGGGAKAALTEAGIEVISGVEGSTDQAILSYVLGELVDAGVNCDHHDHEEGQGCGADGCGSEGGCGGGCGGGCHSFEPMFDGINVGRNVRVHYRGTFDDGTQFDSSYDRGATLDFVCGAGMMILGFDRAVANMRVGESIDIHLMPEEAYGPSDPNAIFTMAIAELPGSESLFVGQQVYMTGAMGQPFPVTVVQKDDYNITLDANHEMAGKELNFHIELIEVL